MLNCCTCSFYFLYYNIGLEICLGKPLDDNLLQVIRKEVQRLSDSLDDCKDREGKDVKSVCSTLALFKSEFDRAIQLLKTQYSKLESSYSDIKNNQDAIKEEISSRDKDQSERLKMLELNMEMRQQQIDDLYQALEVKGEVMKRDLEVLQARMNTLSLSEGPEGVIFEAPEQNKWFTGREDTIEKLERHLTFSTSNEGLKTIALCGLGGCGKTTLGAKFAWKHRTEYKGGVFWISMEDDKKFEKSMNDLALRLGLLADTFDLTLSKVLTWISKRIKPWLLVLDDVDQLHLSEQMHKVLSGRWKRQAEGHVLLTTRREPKEVCESMDVEENCCVQVFAFSEEEAKRFLVTRCGATFSENEGKLAELARELGCLPLALEQAGAHIKALQCPISIYLEEYKVQRLKLLSQHPRPKPTWEYESANRLAVHTTWLLNFEYVRKSTLGEPASNFVQAAAFLESDEIQDVLINPRLLTTEEPQDPDGNFPVHKQIAEILTKFSLFQRKTSKSLFLHRLVQEVIRNRMTVEETTLSLIRAVRLIHRAFQDCPSPDQILMNITASIQGQPSTTVPNPSLFYLWSTLTCHASEIQQHLKTLLDQPDVERNVKTVVLTQEASRVVYENAVQLSVHGHNEEAKETERFALQILNSCTSRSRSILTVDELKILFPHTLPLPQLFQKIILYSSSPPVDDNEDAGNDSHLFIKIDEFRLRGNAFFKDRRFKEAIKAYTDALEVRRKAKYLDPRLLNNRATAYLKLGDYEKCLADSKEYIALRPNCWKGYTRKALALHGLKKGGFPMCAAAIAYYHDAKSCRRYEAFQEVFKYLDEKWAIVESSETLKRCILENKTPHLRKKVLLLTNKQYKIDDGLVLEVGEVENILCNLDGSNDIEGPTLAAYSEGSEVTISCGGLRFSEKCFVQNISFLTHASIFVAPHGDVEFTNCSFKSSLTRNSAVVVYGKAQLSNCSITDSPGGGITAEYDTSSVSLVKCEINGNGNKPLVTGGIRVIDEGSLEVDECVVYGNTEGVLVSGTNYNDSIAKNVLIQNSQIYDNKYDGICVSGHPTRSFNAVVIRKNKIYQNSGFGLSVTLQVNNVTFEENMVFENSWWGIWVQSNSGGCYRGNEICNNKMGGIRVGRQSPGKPPCVVEGNDIHDNSGPAFHEGLKCFEAISFPENLQVFFQMHNLGIAAAVLTRQKEAFEVAVPGAVSPLFKSDNRCYQNGTIQINLQSKSSGTNCAFCIQRDKKLLFCKGCMTARYCGKECQKMHWSSHKYVCQAMRQKNTVEVQFPKYNKKKNDFMSVMMVWLTHPSLEPSGPQYASPPPRDGTRFVVKVQTLETLFFGMMFDPKGYFSEKCNSQNAKILIYDRSRTVDFQTGNQPKLYHLIMECGVTGATMSLTKKVYCWASFKDVKTLQIFTHEFPPLQKW